MNTKRSLAQLRADVEALARPPVKCGSRRTLCEERAADLYNVAIKGAGLSQRAAARRFDVDERLVRDAVAGARAVHLWQILALPLEGRIAFARALLAIIPEEEDDSEEARCA